MSIRNIMGMVNTTLPFAWDDSLSVYEMLGKLISKINEVVALVNLKLPDDFEKAFYAKFREYTKEEMQRILDSGEFATILDSLILEFLPVKQEVIDARDGEVSLGAKIKSVDDQLAQMSLHINADKTGVNDASDIIQAAIDSFPLNPHPTHTPKGYSNGGEIRLPKGLYKVTKTIYLKRGVRIVGESRESTQIISYVDGAVFKYLDSGTYIQDEIGIKDLAIYQDPSVVPSSGAGIEIASDGTTFESNTFNIDNVLIEGTYYGIKVMGGIGSAVRNSNISKCVKSGIIISSETATTSSVFENTYCHINGDSGWEIQESPRYEGKVGAYLSFVGCAADSNTNYGYKIVDGLNISFISCGAEENKKEGFYFEDCRNIYANIYSLRNGLNGCILKLVSNIVFVSSYFRGSEGHAINVDVALGNVTIIGCDFLEHHADNKINSVYKVLNLTDGNGLVGRQNNWAIGATQQPDPDAIFTVAGNADSDSTTGAMIMPVFTGAGNYRNTALYAQAITDNTATTYQNIFGSFIANAVKGNLATVNRTSGVYIMEQTRGAKANANVMVAENAQSVPDGEWNIYSLSKKPSHFKGDVQFGNACGVVLQAPNGSRYRLTVNERGELSTVSV